MLTDIVSDQVSFGYTPEKKVFQNMSISADLESRIALVWDLDIGWNVDTCYWYGMQMFGMECRLNEEEGYPFTN